MKERIINYFEKIGRVVTYTTLPNGTECKTLFLKEYNSYVRIKKYKNNIEFEKIEL